MPDVTIRFKAEGGSQVDREIEARAAKLRAASVGDVDAARRSATARRRVESGAAADSIREARRVAAEQAKADAESIRQRMRGLILQGTAQAKAEAKVREMVAQTTKIIEAETGKRVALGSAEHRQVMQLVGRRVAAEGAAQEAITRATAKGAAERERTVKDSLGRIMKAGASIGSTVMGVATNLHGQAQDARVSRAGAERHLGLALYQAGAAAPEVRARMSQMTSFAAANGIASDELAAAANATQTEFSSLGDRSMSPEQRAARFNKFLERSLEARNSGQDIGEYNRLGGMLDNSKLDEGTTKFMLRFMAGASQRGAVETGDVTRTAMQSMVGRVALAQSLVGPGGDRQEAAKQALMQSFSELQVAKTLGQNPRKAGEALRAMNQSLNDSTTQAKMLQNIRTKYGTDSDVEGALFGQRDKNGKSHLVAGARDALGLAELLSKAGVSGLDAMNLFHGGGHGNPQSLQANWRSVLGGFMGTDASGKSYASNVRDLMNPDTALSDNDINIRGADIFSNDAQAQLTRNEETKNNALGDNTNALVALSNKINDFLAQNPAAAAALAGAAPLLTSGAGSAVTAVGSKVLGPAATAAGVSGGTAAAALAAAGVAGAAIGTGITRFIDSQTGYKGPGGSHDTLIEGNTYKELGKALMGNDAAGNDAVNAQRVQTSAAAFAFVRSHAKELASLTGDQAEAAQRAIKRIGIDTDTIDQLARAIGVQMAGANITATVSPVDAAHAAAQGASAAQPPPTRGHRR